MTLSISDLARLETASRLLVSPFAASDPVAWMAEAGQAVRALVGGDHVVLQTADSVRPFFSEDAPELAAGLLDYVAAVETEGVRFTDPIVDRWNQIRRERNINTFTWDMNAHMLGQSGISVHDLDMIREVLRPHGYNDFAAVMGQMPVSESMILVLNRTHGRMAFGEGTVPVLSAVLPSFRSGLDTLVRFGAQREALDVVGEPLAVFSSDAVEIHRTAALTALLEAEPDRMRLTAHLSTVGRDSARIHRPGAGLPITAEVTVTTERGWYTLRSTVLSPGLFGPGPATMVTITSDIAPSLPDAETVRTKLGLSRREAEVAVLVAGGLTNPEVAERLFVSPHTVRHHMENVLLKLDLSSRTAVAARLMQVA